MIWHSTITSRRNAKGFTLIEILVVVAIILILVSILLAIAAGARDRAKRKSTLTELKILEGAMRDYLKMNREPLPPKTWPYPTTASPAYDNFVGYTYDPVSVNNQLCPSDITNWVTQLLADSEAAAKLSNLPKGQDITTPTPNIVILDAWATPIRYVPSHSGNTTTARNNSYFYFISAGPDGKFSMSVNNTTHKWTADEVYSTDQQ